MKSVQLNKDITPLSEFRANAAKFIKRVRRSKRPLIITQHGKGSAVLMGIDEYQLMMDKLAFLDEDMYQYTREDTDESIDYNVMTNQIRHKSDQSE